MRIPASSSQHNFSQVPKAEIQRSSFDRSHGYKSTFDSGYLVPVFVDEVLPGDTFNCQMTAFARLATPEKPFMDNLYLDSFFFFVPLRLIWSNFQRFMGEQDDPTDSTDFLVPVVPAPTTTGFVNSTLFDYFGLPTGIDDIEVSAFWSRAYNLVYNTWFRDQNLQNSAVVDLDDGPDNPADYVLRRRGKRHDYFTSCLPWPQKGPSVSIPLTGDAPVQCDATNAGEWIGVKMPNFAPTNHPLNWQSGYVVPHTTGTAGADGMLYADLSSVAAATINELRQAFQIQRLYERDARGGTRYTEIIRSHFNVVSPDARLQRPEYLGGGSTPVNVNPIAQTSSTDATTPQGNLAAMGTVTATRGHGFVKSFVEHGVIIGMVSVRADLSYQNGINRMWSRQTRFDFYWPALSHIGEQPVLNKEIYAQGTSADDDVFGYQERFAEYRYKPSTICGQFRSNFAQSLDVWHLAQEYSSLPVLDATFIEDNPPVDRVIATPAEPHFMFDALFNLKCARPMPVYGVPGLIDHF